MARFVKLTFVDGTPMHINAEHVTHFYSETGRTVIRFDAPWLDESDCVRVAESLDEVAALLSGQEPRAEPLLGWEEKHVHDPENDPAGIFRRRWYCPYCGEWSSYGMTPYCPFCGHAVLITDKRKEEEEHE